MLDLPDLSMRGQGFLWMHAERRCGGQIREVRGAVGRKHAHVRNGAGGNTSAPCSVPDYSVRACLFLHAVALLAPLHWQMRLFILVSERGAHLKSWRTSLC
eukprot:598926-Rhodomonas_salina.5